MRLLLTDNLGMPDIIRQRREKLAAATGATPSTGGASINVDAPKKISKVSKEALTQFTTQLATLQDAGMPVLRSLRILEGQVAKGPMKVVVQGLADDVEGGTALSEAMAKFPTVFDDLYVNMMRAGEAGGALTGVLNRLAEFLEKADALVRKIKSAMIYPTLVVTFAIAVMFYIMLAVVPKFEQAFQALGGQLPGPTVFLIATSRALATWWWAIILGVAAIVIGVSVWGRTVGGKRVLDRLKLKLPLFGLVISGTQVARFARTLGTLSSSGVERLRSLDIVAEASGNFVFEEAIRKVQTAVREGESMAKPLGETGLFDDIVVNMVDVGEETGELDKMLMKVASNYETTVDNRISALMSVLEPALIITLGVFVGFIVIALFLPLLKIQEMLSR